MSSPTISNIPVVIHVFIFVCVTGADSCVWLKLRCSMLVDKGVCVYVVNIDNEQFFVVLNCWYSTRFSSLAEWNSELSPTWRIDVMSPLVGYVLQGE